MRNNNNFLNIKRNNLRLDNLDCNDNKINLNNEVENNCSKRFLSKNFYCKNCKKTFNKLVNINQNFYPCPKCNYQYSTINNISDNTINESPKNKNTSLNNIDPSLFERNEKLKKILLNKVTPFSKSPFANSITRSHFDFSQILENNLITTPTEDFFIDNYSSNFISNFTNPMTRIVFVQNNNNINSNNKSPPLDKKLLSKIQTFDMDKIYCKKITIQNDRENIDENIEEYEFPNCFICLKDIKLGNKSILLRCGHLFHYNCIYEWLISHSVCPICKLECILTNLHKSSIDIINEQENEVDNNIIGLSPTKKHTNINFDHLDYDDEYELLRYDNESFNNDVNSNFCNINILGEYKNSNGLNW